MDEVIGRIRELVDILNEAGKAYYSESREIMSNYEYDRLYDELALLEKESGISLSNSPTRHVGYEVLSELPKERHESTMLSLDKTKEVSVLKDWLKSQKGILSWKLDGLTIVLTYDKGELVKAVTRGNGEVGEVITNNAKVFKNVPLEISYQGNLVIRGEAVIKYSDFERINEQIEDAEAKYKNPRNLCSGSVRQLNNEITAQRNVHFFAFTLVSAAADGREEAYNNSRDEQLRWLTGQGFDVVEHKTVNGDTLEETVSWFSDKIAANDFPSDGLVLILDDIAYGQSLGTTSKFPRDSIAFKWADEIRETTLKEIEWSASRTGLINPIAVFEPVELEGTTVSRASVHNISIMEGLRLGTGDTITVYKANMIIPQIAENLTRSGTITIPKSCPVCGKKTVVKQDNDIKALYCVNEACLAKRIKSFTHFVGRDAMNIEGLSEATIEKLIDWGFIKEPADIFHIDRFKEKIVEMEGFGEKSYANLKASIEKSRSISLPKLIYSLGINNIGLSNARLLCRQYDYDMAKLLEADREELTSIDGIGAVIADAFISYFDKADNKRIFDNLMKEVKLEPVEASTEEQIFAGMSFVITGAVAHFTNRNEMKALIESKGGKVTGSVTGKTSYLINNDNLSSTAKNKKAKELNIPIITEDEFLSLLEGPM